MIMRAIRQCFIPFRTVQEGDRVVPLSEVQKLVGGADAVVCKTCGVFVARERAKRVMSATISMMIGGHSGTEEEFYCRAHAPAWDESESLLSYETRYYRHHVRCDEHGTPLGYTKVEPPAKGPEAGQ